ncbi:MAG: sensor histidine kinase [Bacteroidetes bacterium]|nr:sensor histidine kinase [Bacteroidota bacterium]
MENHKTNYKIHTIVLIIALFCLSFNGFAQYPSEINKLLKEVKEASFGDSATLFKIGDQTIHKTAQTKYKGAEAEVNIYYANYFYYTRNIDRAKFYFDKAKLKAQTFSNKHIETLANIRLIFIDYELGINEGAEQDFLNLLIETKQTKDFENHAELLNLLGIIKESKNELQAAAELYIEGLAFSESHGLPHYPSVFRNNLGLIKLYSNQPDDALIDFEKGLESAKKENDKNLASHIQINICLIYVKKNRVKEALEIFNDVINYTRLNNHPRELSAAFINMGAEFNRSNKPELALAYLDSSINILQKTKLQVDLTEAYLGKAEVLISLNKNNEAKKNLDLAKALFTKTNNLNNQATYNYLLYTIENSEGKHQSALNYYLSYENIKDSIEKTLNGKLIQELQLKYNVQKKEVELEKEKSKNLLLEQQHQDERFFKWLSIGIALIVLILVISSVYYLYSKKIREKQASFSRQLIENIEEDRLRISMDLHDDIGQSLSMIKTKIAVVKQDPEHKILESELARVIEQTREISKNLYPSYLEKIGLVRSIARLMENIQSSTKIECSFDVADKVEELSLPNKTHIYRILQECTNNTIKHAKASALKISITEKNNEFALIYQDNGIGMSSKQKDGLGLLSIKERAKIINGSVNFEDKTNKSFKLTLKFSA